MLATFAQISVSAQDQGNEESGAQAREVSPASSRQARALVGVWNVQVTRLNCQTGAVIGTASAMLTYARGGTMIDWGTGMSPSLRSPGQGVWSYDSGRNYTSAFQFFRFNADGTLAGRQIVRSQIELSHDANGLINSANAQILDVNGNVIANNCSTATATRFQ